MNREVRSVDDLLGPGAGLRLGPQRPPARGRGLRSRRRRSLAGSLHGGLAYEPGDLRRLFGGYTEVELRAMNGTPADGLFGVPFLLTGLFRR